MRFFEYADIMGPTVAIGQALGRLGCFSAGCCWGGACDAHYALAARFPPESLAYQSQAANHLITAGAPSTIPIHPTQLYEAFGCALIFLVLTFWRERKRFHGELLALYLMLYAPLRSTVEAFRGDEERGRVFNVLGGWARSPPSPSIRRSSTRRSAARSSSSSSRTGAPASGSTASCWRCT